MLFCQENSECILQEKTCPGTEDLEFLDNSQKKWNARNNIPTYGQAIFSYHRLCEACGLYELPKPPPAVIIGDWLSNEFTSPISDF